MSSEMLQNVTLVNYKMILLQKGLMLQDETHSEGITMTTKTEARQAYIDRVTLAIEQAKELYGVSRDQISDHIGLTGASISLYKKDRALPQKHIKPFCEITRVRIDWLLTGEGPMREDQWLQKQITKLQSMTEEEQRRFEALIELTFPEKKS